MKGKNNEKIIRNSDGLEYNTETGEFSINGYIFEGDDIYDVPKEYLEAAKTFWAVVEGKMTYEEAYGKKN